MSFEDELAKRMKSSVDGVVADPDLADVEARAGRAGRRRQAMLMGSVAALVVLAVGSLALLTTRDGSEDARSAATETGLDGTGDTDQAATDGTEPVATSAPTPTLPAAVPGSVVEIPITEPPVTGEVPATTADVMVPGTDRADQYLVGSTEIYQRTLPNGDVFVARVSEEPYSSVFGIEWRAPTGSAEECLGDRALFIGVPARVGWWGSAWVVGRWFDDLDASHPYVVASMSPAVDDQTTDPGQHLLFRVAPDVQQVIVSDADGVELDRADAVNGVAMVAVTWESAPTVSTVTAGGQRSEPVPVEYAYSTAGLAADDPCSPGEPPVPALPAAGEQPADPRSAEKQIRERHALLVDQSLTADEKPGDLLDDNTGIADAVAKARGGQYSEAVGSASYAIDEVVFTAPDEAWFRYSITATTGTFGPRFGQATFNGRVWQISRATLCNDLSLAGGQCQPAAPPIELPNQAEYQQAYNEWIERANLYNAGDGCAPLSQC